jgi:hypothetical protein
MKTMTVEEFFRDVRDVLARFERDKEEIVVLREGQPIARLLRPLRLMTAREAFAGLSGLLTDEEGEEWLRDIEDMNTHLDQTIRDPWEDAEKRDAAARRGSRKRR